MPSGRRYFTSYPVVIDQKLSCDIKIIFVQNSKDWTLTNSVTGPYRTKFLAVPLVRMWVKTGICPSLESRSKKPIFLENLTSVAQFWLADSFLAITVYLSVWPSHCTRTRFTVLLSCSGELALHSCPLPGPAFSRLDRLLPIGPRAEQGPALRLLTYARLCGTHRFFKAWGPLPTKIKVNCTVFLTSSFIIIRSGIVTVVIYFDVWSSLFNRS